LANEIANALADERRGERLRDGLTVAIAGPVNAGKSTLLNRLARREAAIVSPYAGTTRDVIEVHLDLDGWPVTLLDTAGVRETDDPVEMEGVRRARERAASADLVLWVVDASAPAASADRPDVVERAAGPAVWLVRNKVDLLHQRRSESKRQNVDTSEPENITMPSLTGMVSQSLIKINEYKFIYEACFSISAGTGLGMERLVSALSAHAERVLASSEQVVVTRERHRRALEDTLAALRRALAPELGGREDLLAEELRAAAQALGRLTGRVDVEDVLDVIFRDFCIGK
jgi:tRNA modification GTPase